MRIRQKNFIVRLFTGENVIGVTLAPFGIYLKPEYLTNKRVIRHESIHWKQQLEMLIIPFYLWYLIEWFIRLFMKGNAYRNISFEREAYKNENDEKYLENRKLFAWTKYLRKKS
ncbi:MAG: hypothetical protein ABFD07_14035 [Methanobacterium sp.]